MKGLGLLTEISMKAGVKLEPKNIKIDDTTLRDGEQTAGVVFANDEKIHIAKLLDKMGVHQIEAGIPTMGEFGRPQPPPAMKTDVQARIRL